MAIQPFLAMTAAEIRGQAALPERLGWMACHFSPYGRGLCDLPRTLPAGSLLLVDDSIPICGHDPQIIGEQLAGCVESLQCAGVLLDLQRPGVEEAAALVRSLSPALPCPVAVSPYYADGSGCAVCLPPVPPSVPLEAYLAPWKGRDLWIEIGLEGEVLTLTEQGCDAAVLPCQDREAEGFSEARLHCHYQITAAENVVSFTLWRTEQDLLDLLTEAEALGVSTSVGLYQQLRRFAPYEKPLPNRAMSASSEGIL